MYGYIYITTNLINNKIYVGQHKHETYDTSYYGSGKLIKRAIEKYGIENFKNEILDTASSLEELCEKEIFWIKEKKSLCSQGNYNLLRGGQFGDITYGMNSEQLAEFRFKVAGKNNGMYESGKRGIHPKGYKGHHHDKKFSIIMHNRMKGENNPMYGVSSNNFKNGHPKGFKGHHHKETTHWRHSSDVEITLPNGDIILSNNLSKFCREYNIPRGIIDKVIKSGETYVAAGSATKTHSKYNGLSAQVIEKTIPR